MRFEPVIASVHQAPGDPGPPDPAGSLSAAEAAILAEFAKTPRKERFARVARAIAPAIGVVVFLAFWQVSTQLFDIQKFVLPRPADILSGIKDDPGFYIRNARVTLWEAFLGFAIAFVLAIIGATLMAHSRFIERAVTPLAVLIQVTPIIAYAPAVVIWLKFGIKPILVLTSLVCFVPFLINGVTGLRSVDPNLLELARSVNASKREVFWKLRLPSALPHLFAAARIAVGLALIGAVLGEFFAGVSSGLGYSVKYAQSHFLTLQLWGSIYVLALVGSVAILLINGLEKLTLHWHSSQQH